jgi:hypothetical protein
MGPIGAGIPEFVRRGNKQDFWQTNSNYHHTGEADLFSALIHPHPRSASNASMCKYHSTANQCQRVTRTPATFGTADKNSALNKIVNIALRRVLR